MTLKMRIRITILPLLSLLLVTATGVFVTAGAQDSTSGPVALVARSYTDHIVLRYFATTPSRFNTAARLGYMIEKAVAVDGKRESTLQFKPLKGAPFKRWTEAQWEDALRAADKSDTTALKLAGLAMALSGDEAAGAKGDVMNNDLQSLKETRDNADMRFGFTLIASSRSRLASEGLGLRTQDDDVVAGTTYVYRIRVNQPQGAEDEWVYIKIKCAAFNAGYLRNEKAIDVAEGDGLVSFSFPESAQYFAFNVDRSDDGGQHYKKITTLPSLKLKPQGYLEPTDYGFADSGLVNGKKYFYRVWVTTLFADELVLGEFTATPRDRTAPPPPFLRSAEHASPREVALVWEMGSPAAADLKGFAISRSNEERGGYTRITKELLPATARQYTDNGFKADGSNYYVVDAVDSAGNISRSFPAYVTLIDSTPPAPPQVRTAVMDSLGKITIHIRPNGEKDFMGYQVLKANAADHEFSVIEETFKDSLGSTTFVVYDSTTLNTLTPQIYYKLIAFDTHFNQSVPSEIIRLRRRDTIPPVSPLITGFNVADSAVLVLFAPSSSEDAVQNTVLRRTLPSVQFDSVFTSTDTSLSVFTDTTVRSGRQYEYAMVARDGSGLYSRISNTILVKAMLSRNAPAPLLQGSYDREKKEVVLSFQLKGKPGGGKMKLEVYKRTRQDAPWLQQPSIIIEGLQGSFADSKPGAARAYYTVRWIDEMQRSSNFSNEVDVVIQP